MEASTRCAVGALALAYISSPALRAFRVGYLTDFFAPSLAAVLMLRYWSGGRKEVVRELRGIATDWTVTPLRAVVGCADVTVPLLDRVARLLSADSVSTSASLFLLIPSTRTPPPAATLAVLARAALVKNDSIPR